MLSPRRILTVTALCALPLVAGCGGGDDETKDVTAAPEAQADCQATVKLSGAAKASWSGAGYVITGGGNKAFYKTAKGKTSVSIIPGRDDEPATPIATVKGDTYTVQPDAEGVDVDPNGGGAEVDADASGTKKGKPATVRLVATFDC